jgi:hypothetical protein
MLSFPDNIREYITETYGPLTNEHVIVHARRGDYLLKKDFHTNLDHTYYTKALAYMKERIPNAKFIFISDDIHYWKESFNNAIYFNESDIITLWLMMNSSNLIIANSTFSWWGAYLSGGEVVAPKEWFGPEGPSSKDIYEPSWILL